MAIPFVPIRGPLPSLNSLVRARSGARHWRHPKASSLTPATPRSVYRSHSATAHRFRLNASFLGMRASSLNGRSEQVGYIVTLSSPSFFPWVRRDCFDVASSSAGRIHASVKTAQLLRMRRMCPGWVGQVRLCGEGSDAIDGACPSVFGCTSHDDCGNNQYCEGCEQCEASLRSVRRGASASGTGRSSLAWRVCLALRGGWTCVGVKCLEMSLWLRPRSDVYGAHMYGAHIWAC